MRLIKRGVSPTLPPPPPDFGTHKRIHIYIRIYKSHKGQSAAPGVVYTDGDDIPTPAPTPTVVVGYLFRTRRTFRAPSRSRDNVASYRGTTRRRRKYRRRRRLSRGRTPPPSHAVVDTCPSRIPRLPVQLAVALGARQRFSLRVFYPGVK